MKYKKNYIEDFIFRLDFREIKQKTIEKILEQLKNDFKGCLYNLKRREITSDIVKMDESEEIVKVKGAEKELEYRLYNKDDDENITITKDYIYYENKNYKNFEKTKMMLEKMVDSVIKTSDIEICTRIGMRFINDIVLPSENKKEIYDWEGYIKEPLLTNISFFRKENNQDILQAMQVIDINSQIDSNLYYTLQHGLYNGRKPGPMLDKQYIIDIYAHTKIPEEMEDAKEKIDIMHSEIEKIFESVIGNKMRNNMEVCDEK